MYRKFTALAIGIILLSACKKNLQNNACGTQVCTALFATVMVHFADNQGDPIAVSNFEVFDLSTNKQIQPGLANYDLVKGAYIIANDNELKDLSTDGDNIRVTGTNPATGQTKTAIFKVAGGCNCHVTKISGPDTIQFD
ncbi:MAG: hypothetical protein JST19_18325 [Bacteroidetes bacterium]|nr:hypothetical protein [Bacteroidota bacterium]